MQPTLVIDEKDHFALTYVQTQERKHLIKQPWSKPMKQKSIEKVQMNFWRFEWIYVNQILQYILRPLMSYFLREIHP